MRSLLEMDVLCVDTDAGCGAVMGFEYKSSLSVIGKLL